MHDMLMSKPDPLPREHNPKPGVLAVRRASRPPQTALLLMNAMKTRQHQNASARKAREQHRLHGAPVIGHFAPVGGPVRGGTRVTFWGVNFGGGGIYKCRFHNAVVNATYHPKFIDAQNHDMEDTISCVSPPFSQTGAKNLDSVDVAVIVFAADEDSDSRVHHHSTSHRRQWMYYSTERNENGIESDKENQTVTYAQIFPAAVSPLTGPTTGGTIVRIPGRYLLDHHDGYNCRFGSTVVPAVAEHAPYTVHTMIVDETLFCVSPPLPHGIGPKTVTLQIEHASVEKNKANARIGQKMGFRYYRAPDFFGVASRNDDSSENITVSPTKGPNEGGQVLVIQAGEAGSSALLGGTAEKYVCRFGGQIRSTGFYDRGINAVKCLIPPVSAMPLFMDEQSNAEARDKLDETLDEQTSRGDIYFGDNVWGRSRASMLFLEQGRQTFRKNNRKSANLGKAKEPSGQHLDLLPPNVCWGSSPCDLYNLENSLGVKDEFNSMLREAKAIDESIRLPSRGTLALHTAHRHICSDLLNDGEQLTSNIYARLQSRKQQASSFPNDASQFSSACSRAVKDIESSVLGAEALISSRYSAANHGFDSPFWKLLTMKDYPEIWTHHEMASLLTNKSSLEYQALHLNRLEEEIDGRKTPKRKALVNDLKKLHRKSRQNQSISHDSGKASHSYIDVNIQRQKEVLDALNSHASDSTMKIHNHGKRKKLQGEQSFEEATKLVKPGSSSSSLVLGEVVDMPAPIHPSSDHGLAQKPKKKIQENDHMNCYL